MEVDLRSIECAIALVYHIRQSQLFQSGTQAFGCHLPIFITSHAVFRTGGQLYVVFEPKQGIYLVDQVYNALDLVLDLLRCHEDMCIILCETAYSHQTMKLTRFLMTMNDTKLTHTQRQITVGTWLRTVYQNAAWTVHWFNCVILFIDHSCIHVVFVMIPVSGSLPELAIQDDRSGNLYITSFFMDFSPVIKQGIFQYHALRQEERETRTCIVHHEQAKFFAQFTMVTFLCLFHHCDVCFQILFGCKCGRIDTGQHFVLLAASPVCACQIHQLKCLTNTLGVHHVRSCT